MPDTGFISPDSAAHEAGANNDWADPSNVLASDDAYATVAVPALGDGTDTDVLVVSFVGISVPSDATVVGVEVAVEAKMNAAGAECNLLADLSPGSFSGKLRSVSGATDATYTFGGATDLWGATPAVGDVSPTLDVRLLAIRTDILQRTLSVDHVQLKVYYSRPSTAVLFWSSP